MKVISFSLWGQNPQYCQGAVKNSILAKSIYPDWQCWFYCSDDVPQDTKDQLISNGAKIIEMGHNQGFKGLFWRFLAFCTEGVEIAISRDCDSRLGQREAEAVMEWEHSDFMVHAMYDHPHHYGYLGRTILGGMWGAKSGFVKDFYKKVLDFEQSDKYGTDYEFLAQILPELLEAGMFVHCSRDDSPNDFPTMQKSEHDFIGAIFDENDQFKITNH